MYVNVKRCDGTRCTNRSTSLGTIFLLRGNEILQDKLKIQAGNMKMSYWVEMEELIVHVSATCNPSLDIPILVQIDQSRNVILANVVRIDFSYCVDLTWMCKRYDDMRNKIRQG